MHSAEDTTETVISFGRLQPVREASLSFARAGVVGEVLKHTGETVSADEALATLDQPEIVDRKNKTEANLQSLQDQANDAPEAQAAELAPRIAELQGQVNALDAELQKGRLTAPFAGILAVNNIKSGDTVSDQMTAMIVMEAGSPLVELNLDAQKAAGLTDDQQYWVGLNNMALPARQQDRSPIRGPRGGERILLEFKGPPDSEQWNYHDVVEVRFRADTGESGYWLPLSALQRTVDGPWSVLLAVSSADDEGASWTVKRVECEVLRYENDRVLIRGEQFADALVITDGSHRIVPGQAVVVIRDADELPEDAAVEGADDDNQADAGQQPEREK